MLFGPAFVTAISYVDPGNVAANVSAGTQFGYLLAWVIILANTMAGLVQYLSAKLGIVTGKSLPEIIAEFSNTSIRVIYWLQAELVALATDLSEVVGGAVALNLMFNLSLLLGGLITSITSLLLLNIQNFKSQRTFEYVITFLLVVITVGFLSSLMVAPPSVDKILEGLIPHFQGPESLLISTAMLGATLMPHAIYLHSDLTRDRYSCPISSSWKKILLRTNRFDVILAMFLAGAVNLAMLLIAANSLQGCDKTESIEGAYAAMYSTLGSKVTLLFAIGLLASGLASTSVGSYAGSVIIQGLLKVSYPQILRRSITIIPAVIILALNVDPSRTLILSQVVLSFGIPLVLMPLVWFTSNKSLMGINVNHCTTTIFGWILATLTSILNATLIYFTTLV